MKKNFIPVIGLEIHIELKTESKMFCSCSASHFGKEPNTQTCPVCLGLPGALPAPNEKAIKFAIMAGLSLGCCPNLFSKFDRKNYFYPDLPKGYQISQYDLPFCQQGSFSFVEDGKLKTVRIRRAHLEEDTAKLVHQRGQNNTLIDFNRSGVPLLEIVTEPDFEDGHQAKIFLQKLQQIIRYLKISDCDMEKGSMRLEANISLGEEKEVKSGKLPNYKVEIKNLNSFRFIQKAISYEIERQRGQITQGKKIVQETRGWDQVKNITFLQRVKEEAKDHRYFPEPDIPPFRFEQRFIDEIRASLPELPESKIDRWIKVYGLSRYQAEILADSLPLGDYFDQAAFLAQKEGIEVKNIADVIINRKIDFTELPASGLIKQIKSKQHSRNIDMGKLTETVREVVNKNTKVVEDYKKGRQGAVEYLLGQVMAATKGQANPQAARQLIVEFLQSELS